MSTQRFPSGLETPDRVHHHPAGRAAGLLAIGKNLRAVAELQSRLVEAQQAMERDYWKLREVETRYRLLFNSSRDAVLLLQASNLAIVDLNPAAAQALGIAGAPVKGARTARFPDTLLAEERDLFEGMIRRIRERGKAPGVLLRLGQGPDALAGARLPGDLRPGGGLAGPVGPVGGGPARRRARPSPMPIEDLIEGGPDGFVVIDHQGAILRANRAFLDLVQMGSESAVLGEPLGRWLGRPGADLTVLLANVLRLGAVRLFSTVLHGELGSEVEAEISATGQRRHARRHHRRLHPRRQPSPVWPATRASGIDGLMESLDQTDRQDHPAQAGGRHGRGRRAHYIEAALELAGSNRTVAAELLGLSRQSLYVKLNRYGLEDDAKPWRTSAWASPGPGRVVARYLDTPASGRPTSPTASGNKSTSPIPSSPTVSCCWSANRT